MTIWELMQDLKEARDICHGVLTEQCKNGQCLFSTDSQHGCLFEDMGMNHPYDWDLNPDEFDE